MCGVFTVGSKNCDWHGVSVRISTRKSDRFRDRTHTPFTADSSRSRKYAEPVATAPRPCLSRIVQTHTPRQPRSWLTWDVRQTETLLLFRGYFVNANRVRECIYT